MVLALFIQRVLRRRGGGGGGGSGGGGLCWLFVGRAHFRTWWSLFVAGAREVVGFSWPTRLGPRLAPCQCRIRLMHSTIVWNPALEASKLLWRPQQCHQKATTRPHQKQQTHAATLCYFSASVGNHGLCGPLQSSGTLASWACPTPAGP